MKSKKIYLIRHGQTDFNKKRIVQGSGVNSSLNGLGRIQAEAFYNQYKNIKFDKVYTSSLKRTVETVRKFIQQGIPHIPMDALNEISWGDHEGKEYSEDRYAHYAEIIGKWKRGEVDVKIVNGESPLEVAERQLEFLKAVKEDDADIVLVSSHGRAMRILLCQMLNYPLKYMDKFEHTNVCLYVINFTGSSFIIEQHNEVKHLELVDQL